MLNGVHKNYYRTIYGPVNRIICAGTFSRRWIGEKRPTFLSTHKERNRRWPYTESVFCVDYICSIWIVLFVFDRTGNANVRRNIRLRRCRWRGRNSNYHATERKSLFHRNSPDPLYESEYVQAYRTWKKPHCSRTPLRDSGHNGTIAVQLLRAAIFVHPLLSPNRVKYTIYYKSTANSARVCIYALESIHV